MKKNKQIPSVSDFLKNIYPDVFYEKIKITDNMLSAIEIDYFNRYGKRIYLVYPACGGFFENER